MVWRGKVRVNVKSKGQSDVSFTRLIGGAGLILITILFDAFVLTYQVPDNLGIILVGDVGIFMALAFFFVVRPRRQRVRIQGWKEKLTGPRQEPSSPVEGGELGSVGRRTAQGGTPSVEVTESLPSISLHSGTDTGIEASVYLEKEPAGVQPAKQEPKALVYRKSPDGLRFPAFICKCGHPHRFVCLTCGMTREKALNKKGARWVEWTSQMAEIFPEEEPD